MVALSLYIASTLLVDSLAVLPTYSAPLHLPPPSAMSQTFSAADVGAHKTKDDLWIIVDEDVYDLTKFQTDHPGASCLLSTSFARDPLTLRRWPEECAARTCSLD